MTSTMLKSSPCLPPNATQASTPTANKMGMECLVTV